MEGKIQHGIQSGTSDVTTGKRFIRVDAIHSEQDRQMHLFRTEQVSKLPNELCKYALIVKRNSSSKGIVASIHVEINSQCLPRVLQDVFPDAESLGLDKEKVEVTGETLWHAWPALRTRLEHERTKEDRTRDDAIISDIEAALDFLQDEYATKTSHLTALQDKGLITYSLLWCLFPPHVEVYTDVNALHEPQILVCKSCSYSEDERTGEKWFAVHSECLNHDGQNFGWSEQVLKIPYFKGTAHITSLLAYPLACHPDEMGLRGRLHARGKTFVELLTQPRCREYGSLALISRRAGSEWVQEASHVSGRVMVDPDRFSKPNSSSDPLREPSSPNFRAFSPTKTPDKDLMFCHYRIIGFSFERKGWVALAVSQLRDPEWDKKALDKVIMAPARRELLRSLVSAHQPETEGHGRSDDVSKSRSRGLVGLLSGPPGVGKTVTAEAAAEEARRPLYAVSAGELGTEIADVDRRLGKLLDIASSWKCVLLIEECEVFLRQRDHVSLVNNALVSIFRRRLEHFQGLAILTTNRIEDIDKALLSRLHFKLHYEGLGNKQRLAVWKSSLGVAANLNEEKIVKLATNYELNGHEIKNTVSCAKLIAQSQGITLTFDLVQQVLDELSPPCSTIKDTQDVPGTFRKDGHPLRNGTEYRTNVERLGGTTPRVDALMRDVRDNAVSVEANQVFRLATQDQVDKMKQMLEAQGVVKVSAQESNLAAGNTFIYAGSGNLNLQFGNGDMFTVNSGGTVNKAQRMSVGPMPTSTG